MITNEHVLDMVRNTIQEEGLSDQLKEAIFEPKMTRLRAKEVREKGTVSIRYIIIFKCKFTEKNCNVSVFDLEWFTEGR